MYKRKALLLIIHISCIFALIEKVTGQAHNAKLNASFLLSEEGSGEVNLNSDVQLHLKEELGSGYGADDEDLVSSNKNSDYSDFSIDNIEGSGDDHKQNSQKSENKENFEPEVNIINKDYDLNFEKNDEIIPIHSNEGIRNTESTTRFGIIGMVPDTSIDVHIVGKGSDRPTSFFAQPGFLAAVIGGAVVGLLCAVLIVMYIVYRMRKKDEGSYSLYESKRGHIDNSYVSPRHKEFYA